MAVNKLRSSSKGSGAMNSATDLIFSSRSRVTAASQRLWLQSSRIFSMGDGVIRRYRLLRKWGEIERPRYFGTTGICCDGKAYYSEGPSPYGTSTFEGFTEHMRVMV